MSTRGLVPHRNDLFAPIEQHFNKFFEEFWNQKGLDTIKATAGFPKLNAYEKNGELYMTFSVAGISANDLHVDVTPDGYLVLSGKMSEEHQSPEDAVWYIRELRQSSFERRLKLPDSVEGDPKAMLKDGMLTLKWSLKNSKKELQTTKRITVNSG